MFDECSQVQQETGATVSTKGVWYPDRSKATAKDPPLYIHVSAKTKEILEKGVEKVNELINMDMGSLVDKGEGRRERVSHANAMAPMSKFLTLG